MKFPVLKYSLVCALAISFTSLTAQQQEAQAPAQESNGKYDTLTLQVKGVCKMCKARIEGAVYDMKGVKWAEWDLDTETLTTIVKSGKVDREEIAETLAKKGHESDLLKAYPEGLAELPECCRYDLGVPKHGDE